MTQTFSAAAYNEAASPLKYLSTPLPEELVEELLSPITESFRNTLESKLNGASQHPTTLTVHLSTGTFDPIHVGHVRIAERARWQFGGDLTIVIPNGVPPHKPNVTNSQTRLNMVDAALQNCKPHYFVSELETARPGNSYTYDTILLVHEAARRVLVDYPEVQFQLSWIVGQDVLRPVDENHKDHPDGKPYLVSWEGAAFILKYCRLLVAPRNDYDKFSQRCRLDHWRIQLNQELRKQTFLAPEEAATIEAQIEYIDAPNDDVSSSYIRKLMAEYWQKVDDSNHPVNNGYPLYGLVNNRVYDLIREEKLYCPRGV
jgi:nicotinate (nicotinamide) nucleotide adenylyltransferase